MLFIIVSMFNYKIVLNRNSRFQLKWNLLQDIVASNNLIGKQDTSQLV